MALITLLKDFVSLKQISSFYITPSFILKKFFECERSSINVMFEKYDLRSLNIQMQASLETTEKLGMKKRGRERKIKGERDIMFSKNHGILSCTSGESGTNKAESPGRSA